MNDKFETISSETKFDGKIIRVTKNQVILPDGNIGTREKIETNDGVGVLALTPDDEVLMVRQFRYGMMKFTTEIPAGKMENDEQPYESAMRELREETGFTAKKLVPLSPCEAMAAICTERVHLFLAETDGMEYVGTDFDEDEFIELRKISFDKAVEMVMRGEILDSKTVSAILQLYVMRSRNEK